MNKHLLYIIGLLSIIPCHAQTAIDTVAYRFIYDVQAKTFETNHQLSPDEHWLDIGKNGISKYYSWWKERQFYILDSLHQIGADVQEYRRISQEQGIGSSQFNYDVYKNYPITGQQTIDYHSLELFQYQESMGQDWQFADGDTVILGHPCQKVSCRYHGKTWIAYYATDIPISEGPWKLCGLPGIILRTYDSDGAFIIQCIGIQKQVESPIIMRNSKRKKLTPEQAHKVIEQIDSDPDAYMEAQGHKVMSFDEKGRPIKMPLIPKRAYYESYSVEENK